MKYEKVKNYYGMNYVTVYLRVDGVDDKHGTLVSAETMRGAELGVAAELIKRRVQLRGIEVRFLRKSLGLSFRELGRMIGLSHMAIAKWEKAKSKRLDPVNEVALRSLLAQLLKLNIQGWFDELKGTDKAPGQIEVKAA